MSKRFGNLRGGGGGGVVGMYRACGWHKYIGFTRNFKIVKGWRWEVYINIKGGASKILVSHTLWGWHEVGWSHWILVNAGALGELRKTTSISGVELARQVKYRVDGWLILDSHTGDLWMLIHLCSQLLKTSGLILIKSCRKERKLANYFKDKY